MTIYATISDGANPSATVTSVDGEPNAVLYTAHGGSQILAAISLCRRLIEQGADPEAAISFTPANSLTVLYQAI